MAEARPNVLFLMADQMQGRVLRPGHVCRAANLRRLCERGVRFARAYTPNAVCSPARASLMTGLLPHNHGVRTVTHCVDADQSCLRDVPHWAQRLEAAGYRTGYFGKWHVERSNDLARFGWQTACLQGSDAFGRRMPRGPAKITGSFRLENDGYESTLLYGVTDRPAEERPVGVTARLALAFLDEAMADGRPWCCFVSVPEPHDPFVCGAEALAAYGPEALALPASGRDDLRDKPGMYRKLARQFAHLTDAQRRQAMACYYGSIDEIDGQFGRILDRLEAAGQADRTLVVLTSDHGELLGAHGLWSKNVGAFEEVYNVPMVLAGPGVARGQMSEAVVGLHDLAPTLLELCGFEAIGGRDSRSFAAAARDPDSESRGFPTGYAEFDGTRYLFTQRVAWDGPWKLVHNGFDFDELYNLDEDPHELRNLAEAPAHREQLRRMMKLVWRRAAETGDHTLVNSHYPAIRMAPFGPLVD